MNAQQMRNYVADLYKGPRWSARVAKMSDAQVFAIYKAKQKHDEEKKEK